MFRWPQMLVMANEGAGASGASSGLRVDGEPRRRLNEESLVFDGDFMEVEWESMRVLG